MSLGLTSPYGNHVAYHCITVLRRAPVRLDADNNTKYSRYSICHLINGSSVVARSALLIFTGPMRRNGTPGIYLSTEFTAAISAVCLNTAFRDLKAASTRLHALLQKLDPHLRLVEYSNKANTRQHSNKGLLAAISSPGSIVSQQYCLQ